MRTDRNVKRALRHLFRGIGRIPVFMILTFNLLVSVHYMANQFSEAETAELAEALKIGVFFGQRVGFLDILGIGLMVWAVFPVLLALWYLVIPKLIGTEKLHEWGIDG